MLCGGAVFLRLYPSCQRVYARLLRGNHPHAEHILQNARRMRLPRHGLRGKPALLHHGQRVAAGERQRQIVQHHSDGAPLLRQSAQQRRQ